MYIYLIGIHYLYLKQQSCSSPHPGRILAGKKVPRYESGGAIDEWRERFMFPVATDPAKIKSSLYLMVNEEEFSQKPSSLIIPGCEFYSKDDVNDATCDSIAAVLAFVQAIPPIRALLRDNENEVGNIIDKLIQGGSLTEDESFGIFNELDLDGVTVDSFIGDAVACVQQMHVYYQCLVGETDEPVPPTCSICLDELDNPWNKETLPCGHSLHHKCLKQILAAHPTQPKCPICRHDLPPTELSVQICIPPNGIVGISEDEHTIEFHGKLKREETGELGILKR